jgi:hypothetical protein
MNNVSTFEACASIRQAAEKLGDEDMLRVLLSVNNDLIAAEAKYHKSCLASYTSKSNLKHRVIGEANEDAINSVFKELATEINEGITQGRAYDMSSLLMEYRERLQAREIAADNFSTKQRLKCRLEKYFGDSVVFHRHPDKSNPEIVYSSAISLQDVLNALAASDMQRKSDVQEIVATARKIKEDIKKCNGIPIRPLNVDDVSLDSARRIILNSLYWLVRLMLTSDDNGIEDFDHQIPCTKAEKERQILSIAQDIIHCASNARVKLPKQIGLAMTVRHLTGSKQLVTLLNRMGHSSSYDNVQAVDTSFATEVLAKMEAHGTVIPSNISLGPFVQLAADNNDLNEETLDGKNTTHATTMVIYQRRVFGPELPPTTPVGNHSKRRRSLKKGGAVYELQECSAHGRRPKVNQYTGAVDYQWLKDGTVLSEALNRDVCWALLRMKPACLMETGISQDNVQQVPGWGGYQSIINPAVPVISKIGYCPMIEGASTDFTTVYTVLKHAQKVSAAMGQRDAVITFDLAIYMQAKQIQMKFPEEFSNTVVRLGGFHIALNYLSLLGKMFRSSGLEDLLIESGVYAAGTTSAIMKGKSYNRGVRAHKLVMEGLFRLMWSAFGVWYNGQAGAGRCAGDQAEAEESEVTGEGRGYCPDEGMGNGVNKELVVQHAEECRLAISDKAGVQGAVEAFHDETTKLRALLQEFTTASSAKSNLFSFWGEYVEMVKLLLQFIKAERTGNWELHLQSVAAMVPHFFAMNRPNYSRWLPVYIMDMRQLSSKHPEVYQEFMNGNHAISRSNKPFAQVWTDMALEQSINADSKSIGGIIGISQNPGALDRWFLTSHERASVTTAFKAMYMQERNHVDTHKEAATRRVERDEADVQKLLSCFTTNLMINPFSAENESLANIATGVVLPANIAGDLVQCTKKGKEMMNTFVEKRLNTNEVSFWDPISQLKVKTFESTTKKVKVKAIDDKLVTIGADRELFGRLLIAANARQINLKDVLCYELSPIPFSLAHPDGSLRKTTKSALLPLIEAKVQVSTRLADFQEDTIHLIDGMALVHVLKSAGSATFGELAANYYKVMNCTVPVNITALSLVFVTAFFLHDILMPYLCH